MPFSIEIRPFDRLEVGEGECRAWNECGNRLRAETLPEDPPVSIEETTRNLRVIPPDHELRLWAAWSPDGAEIVATGRVTTTKTGVNQHLAEFFISVLPEWRRQGIGRRLLSPAAEAVRATGRGLMMSHTDSFAPAGESFMERLGAQVGLVETVSQLDLELLDRALMRQWQERAGERAAGFELGLWEGPYPEDALETVAAMLQAINLAPRGDLQIEDEVWTPEMLRDRDQAMIRRGADRWTLYARETATGRFAGYTQLYWSNDRPETLQQGDTAVFPEFRNRGLARWLKAAMVEKVLCERPVARRIRTDNASTNASMLRINVEMGFRPFKTWKIWQVEVERVERYLGSSQ
jgi:GNAT superfamily N-acetyltransferase